MVLDNDLFRFMMLAIAIKNMLHCPYQKSHTTRFLIVENFDELRLGKI